MRLTNTFEHIRQWLSNQIVFQKLNNPFGAGLLATIAIIMAYAVAWMDLKFGMLLLMGLTAIPLLFMALANQTFAIIAILILAIFVVPLKRLIDAPFGLALDGLLFLSFFGVLVQQAQNRDLRFANNPISFIILIWIAYNLLQIINPVASSGLAWLFTVRSMAGLILLYFIACYAFKSLKSIKLIFKWVIGLGLFCAIYGLKQEFIGFSDNEMAWLHADPTRYLLIVQWSRIRIFSFFSDPTTCGIVMACLGTFCFILATGPFSSRKRLFLFISGGIMFLTMAFAGSRTPFVIVPLGFMLFLVLTLKKEFIIGLGLVFAVSGIVILKGSSNAVLYRISSAFDPRKSDDTMKVRFENQKLIQPFILSHPVGAGLGSTGVWGKRFSPDSMLAGFAHDSGFVRIAVELGWIGLIIYMIFLYLVLKTSIYYYLRVRNREIKVYYLAFTVIFFQMTLASYPQEVLTMLPTSIIFYLLVAAMVRLKDFDDPIPQHTSPISEDQETALVLISNELSIPNQQSTNNP